MKHLTYDSGIKTFTSQHRTQSHSICICARIMQSCSSILNDLKNIYNSNKKKYHKIFRYYIKLLIHTQSFNSLVAGNFSNSHSAISRCPWYTALKKKKVIFQELDLMKFFTSILYLVKKTKSIVIFADSQFFSFQQKFQSLKAAFNYCFVNFFDSFL